MSLLFFNHTYGQKYVLNFSSADSISKIVLQHIDYQRDHINEKSVLKTIDSVKVKIETMGFLNYRLDSIIRTPVNHLEKRPQAPTKELNTMSETTKSNSKYIVFFNLGNQIHKIRIYFEENDNELLNPTFKKEDSPGYFEIEPNELSQKLETLSQTLEKKGNSFSEVSLKNILIKNDSIIEARLFITKSTLRQIDKIMINGYSSFPIKYLKHQLLLENNSVFNTEKLNNTSTIINSIPFVSEIKPPEVLFTKDSTIVYLSLKKENASSFDGLIGFTSKENGKGLSLNGYLDLSLINLFNSGENFNLVWKNNGNNRQIFNFDIALPYVFNTKLSPSGALNIYKQDSSFVNTSYQFRLEYKINNRSTIGLALQSENSTNLLTNQKNTIEDYTNLFYGINYNYQIQNNHLLFKTKFNLHTEALIGTRESNIKSKQTQLNFKTNYLWSLNDKNHIFLQNQSALLNSETYLNNELLRIGGTSNLRGFDEESIVASGYSILSLEYRYATNLNSYLYSITDVGHIENKNANFSSQLYAFGLGYGFTSKLGFINLSYALGKTSEDSFNISNSRFHIRIINKF